MADMACIRFLLEICSLLTLAWANPRLLFANRRDIRIIDAAVATNNTADRDPSQVVINNLEDAAAVDYLHSACYIFWTDVSNEMIKYTYCNGTQKAQEIVTTGLIAPDGLACDWIGLKIYWTDSETNRVEVSELDGSSRKVLFWQDLDQPRAIALDPENGYLYWTDWGEVPKIERAGMDGSYRTTIIDDNIFWPNGLTIDYSASKLYWADAKNSYIHSASMDGSNRQVVIQGMLPHPFALTLFDNLIYWTDWETKSIHTCDKITGAEKRVVHDNLYSPMDIHVYDQRRQPQNRPSPCGNNNGGCSHLCLMAPGPEPPDYATYACACPTGVKLLDDELTCADGAEEILLLARRRDIRRISLDTEDYTDVVLPLPDILHAIAIDYDPVDGFIYWTDDDVKAIRRAKPDGTESDYIVTSDIDHPDGVAVDWVARNIYWTATGTDRIEVARLNGTSRKILISDYLDEPRAIAVDPAAGFMYWTDWGQVPKIERAALDGTGRQVLVNTSLTWPNGLALDYEHQKIYWGDGKEDRIEMADMNGRNRRVLVSDGIPHIFGFTLLGDYVYWTDWQRRRIERVNKITGLERQIIREQLPDLMGLKAVNVKKIIGTNPCKYNNGGCSHLCLYRSQGHICSCPMGLELLADQRTCIVPEAFLLFSLTSGIWRISLETSHNNNEIPLTGIKEAAALDFNDGMVYWSDTALKTISKAYMNGTGVENVIEFGLEFPEGIAVDWVAHNIYFSDTGTNRIEVARLDGSARRVIVWQDIMDPRSIAIDPAEGFLYFSDWGGQTTIERAYMDGSHRKVLIDMPGRANGLTIDYGDRRLYWTAVDTRSIESSDLIGTSQRQIIANELEHPFSLTQYGDYIYFADWETNSIDRLNKTSGANRTRIQNDVEYVMDILVMHSSRQEGWNLCAVNNGGCEHLCLSHPNSTTGEWGFVCGCPTHFILNPDGKTCTAPESFLLFSRRNSVSRMAVDMEDSPIIMMPIHTIRNIKAIEYDPIDKQLYWIDGRAKTVRRVNETGIEPHTFIRNAGNDPKYFNPYDFAIEPYSRLLFWTCSETNVINVTRLDGNAVGVVISGDTERPRALALIPEKGMMFWTNLVRNQPKIERASLDGTEHKVLFSTGLGELGALAADYKSNRLYWVDTFLDRIETADISGANRKTLVGAGILNPVGMAVFGEYLFWADRQAQLVARVDKLTGKGLTRVIDELTLLSDIVMVNGDLQDIHPCIIANGGCSHLCIAKEDGHSRCSCPIDLVLQDDDLTCGEPPTCTPVQFSCLSGTIGCVPLAWLCDNQDDCEDASDERNCPYCEGEDDFKCTDGRCILASQRCDNHTDCDIDEISCYGNCRPDQHICANQQCLDMASVDARCDGIYQCRDLSDEHGCDRVPPPNDYKRKGMPSALVGALVAGAFLVLMFFGFVMIWRRCRYNTQGVEGQYDAAANQNCSTVLMLNQLSKDSNSHKYLSGTGRANLKATNLHKAGPKSSSSSCGLYERNHPTGASSCSSEMMSSSGNSGYPKETLNPPPSPVTTRSQCTTELYYTPQSPTTSRSYRHYKMRNIPPHPTPCSTDVCEDSEPYASTGPPKVHQKHMPGHLPHHHHHHHHQKHTRRKKGKFYTNVSNLDLNFDSEPYPPPPTPRSQLSDNYESCPPSPSTERSFYNPYPPPPSPATDST